MKNNNDLKLNNKWISCETSYQAPLFRRTFILNKIGKSHLLICGLGFYELYINGKQVGDNYFKPAWTDYVKRDLSSLSHPNDGLFTHRILYNNYDVADMLKPGKNVIAVMLGNGWFRQNRINCQGYLSYSEQLKLSFRLETSGRTIESDSKTLVHSGYMDLNNIYLGETHDYSRFPEKWIDIDFDDTDWKNSISIPSPKTEFRLQDCPSDKVYETIKPNLISEKNGVRIYDAGRSLSGWVRVEGVHSSSIFVRYSEQLSSTLEIDYSSIAIYSSLNSTEKICSSDIYYSTEGRTNLHPHFTWHGFRYFEVKGEFDKIFVDFVCADVRVKSIVKTDNKVFNWLFDATKYTLLANMHCGVITDCPHRERLGYTGDGLLICDVALWIADCNKFFKKWIQDVADCQDLTTGHVQHTAPFYGGGGGPSWGTAILIVPYTIYLHTLDKDILKKYYPNMLYMIDSFVKFKSNGLVVKEIEGGWCLGDWCTPEKVCIPDAYVNTCHYLKTLFLCRKISKILKKPFLYGNEIEESKKALIKYYYDKDKNTFCNGIQGADAFALNIGLGNDDMLQNIIKHYEQTMVFNTGIIGTDILMDVFADNGCYDLMIRLITSNKYPSLGYMMENGSNTLWENWEGDTSHCHHMFGALVKHYFSTFLGIKIIKNNSINICPIFLNEIKTLNGETEVNGKKIMLKYTYKNKHKLLAEIFIEKGLKAFLTINNKKLRLKVGINKIELNKEE